MSLPPPEPYQSKLFNFLNRQTIRVKEQVKRTVRQAKLAATWGVQVVMYPIYLIFQSTRYSSYRFKQAVRENWQRLQPSTESQVPPAADAPIGRVLKAIEQLQLDAASIASLPSLDLKAIAPHESSSLVNSGLAGDLERAAQTGQISVKTGLIDNGAIISVASLLETRDLVLVTADNQILDVLNPEQQQKLMQRIIWEVAVYRHQRRLWGSWGRQFSPKISLRSKSKVLPPIRWFWETMAWLQKGRVAIAIDLFQESSLVTNPVLESSINLGLSTNIAQLIQDIELPGIDLVEERLNSLDVAIAKVETYLLSQPYSPNLTSSELSRSRRDRLSQENEGQFRLQNLIWAAIDYFFGFKRTRQTAPGELPSESATPLPDLLPNSDRYLPTKNELDEADPWLSWTDLFAEPPLTEISSSKPQTKHLPESKSTSPRKLSPKTAPRLSFSDESDPPQSAWSLVKGFFGWEESSELPKNLASASSSQVESSENSGDLAPESRKQGELIVNTSNSIEYNSNWIEAEASSKGYVKHPLQKVLEWLDKIALSIEKLLERIYLKVKKWLGFK
jgi:hypothetical protein